MIDKLKATMMSQAMKLMTDPRVMKMLSNPKVMSLFMQGLQLKSTAEEFWAGRSQLIAERFNLATREEVDALKAELEVLRSRVRED
jgi:hypothetical protein